MKKTFLLAIATAPLFCAVGCITSPALSPQARDAEIERNQAYDAQQIVDDWDHFWLVRPTSHLTNWNAR